MCACIHEYHVNEGVQENQNWALDPLSWSYKWFWSYDMNDQTQIWVFKKGN